MIPYASQTSGVNRHLIEAAGWRFMVSPYTAQCNGLELGVPYAIDNGAWGAFVHKKPWNESEFMWIVDALGHAADFVVIPDVVANKDETLKIAEHWIKKLDGLPLYLALQDGMTWTDADAFTSSVAGFFLGGSTDWKLKSMIEWGSFCHTRGKRLHVGRVNTVRRIRLCYDSGADSFDGSSVTRFAKKNLRRLNNEVAQMQMFDMKEVK